MNIQNKFKKTNTIYKITKDMDLEGSTLIIPVGCTLDFQGGSFKNGTIEGNGTAIQSELRRIFDDNIVLEGMWNVKEAYPEWFGGKGDGVTDNTQAINNCIKYFTNTYISAGTYITNQIDDIPSFRTINGCGKKSIIQANPKMNLTNSYLLRTKNGGSGITFSNFVLLGGANSTESNYKIGGIYLRSTSNDVNDQWDTRNIIQNVEIKYCYAASIYVGTYQRENKISNCFITHTTNVGINCMGTDNMIIGCTVASSHHEGIVINGNNRVDSCKCFGCGASSTVTGKYALSLIGSKCNVSNVELQQNNYGGCIIQGNSNYVQITCDNNGSGTTNTVLGCHVVGSYNTVSVTSYNFSFHDDQYERYFVSTNWNTVGNNITVNGTPLQKNKMSALSPWSIDNICNNIMWNGYNITQSREVPFDKLVLPDLFRSNGTGSFYVNDSGLSFKLTSVTAVNVDALVQAISIHNSNAIDPDGCFSVKARFHKDGDIDTSVYPIIRVITRYKDSSGTTLTRVDQNTTVNLLDNKDSLDVYALTQYHYLSDKPISILSVSVEFAIRSTKLLSDVSINAYFDDIKIGATTSGNKVKFVNTNIDGTLASKVIIANKLSDFTQENTIYKITTDLNLNTAILELPANCTLDFQGGSISNGTIIGSNTTVLPNGYKIQNVSLEGSFKYPDGVNAVSSDGLCLNNVYDILDKQNLATTEVNNYVVKDDDYTILSQFDTLKNVNAVDGSFIGFPTSVIYNNLLYCFYYKANTHESTPGIQENIYYKYSSDKGITWSEEKEWVLPSSDSNGTYRSYRTAYVVPFGSNLLFGIFCTTTTSSAIGGSFTLVCEATISEAHDITILNQIKTPIVGASGSLVYNYTDATITNSMIIGGNIIQVGSNYLMACYTSNRNNYVFSFDGNFTDNTHITQLDVISSEQFDYTEHAFIKFSDTNFYIAFREDARRENTPIFKYDTSTSKFELFTYIDNVAYDGLDAIILDDNTAMIAGRDARNQFTPTRFALMNSSGKVFISNAKYYGDVLGRDCGYCSLQIIEDILINIFYLKRSLPNYNYGVVSRRIPVKTLTNLIFY